MELKRYRLSVAGIPQCWFSRLAHASINTSPGSIYVLSAFISSPPHLESDGGNSNSPRLMSSHVLVNVHLVSERKGWIWRWSSCSCRQKAGRDNRDRVDPLSIIFFPLLCLSRTRFCYCLDLSHHPGHTKRQTIHAQKMLLPTETRWHSNTRQSISIHGAPEYMKFLPPPQLDRHTKPAKLANYYKTRENKLPNITLKAAER